MRVGIITYHSAYNFGSVLQALATQKSVERLGYQAEIINYRMRSQRDFYSFYRKKYGIKTLAKDILLTPHNRERHIRNERFEKVIHSMNLTDEYVEPEDVAKCESRFDCFISGSDQIWNKRSCELTPVGWEYMNPYLLEFTDKKKISYASSIASMKDDEIDRIIPYIKEFDHISFREKISSEIVTSKLGRKIETVLDPTLLISRDEWVNLLKLKDDERDNNYILFYSLAGYKDVEGYLLKLEKLAKNLNLIVYSITPFISYFSSIYIKHIYDVGPVEFLQYIVNARLIVTDSYHGTLFSINFNKPFYSITDGSESHMRKNQILEELDLVARIAMSPEDVKIEDYCINSKLHCHIKVLRQRSIEYLDNAISS
jgi:hypothetical protein